MTQRNLRRAMDRACVLFSDLIEGRWEKVDGEFDATLRGHVLTDRFVPVWAKVVDSAGSFERIDSPSARQFGDYTLVDVPLAFAAGGAIGEVIFDRADKVAGLALEFPYPRPRQLEQRRRQWEQGVRKGGFIVRNPEIDGLMRHSALAHAQPAYACWQRPLPIYRSVPGDACGYLQADTRDRVAGRNRSAGGRRPSGMRPRTRTSLGLLAAACTAAAVAGCGSAPATTTAVDAAIVRGVATAEPAVSPRPLAVADTAFGLGVMRAWCAENPDQNLVFSPSTLASALGMAYLGARGSTATAMARVLDLPAGTSRAALEAQLQARMRALGSLDGPGVTLAASDQVWADPTMKTLGSYLNAVATGYHAGVAQAPFSTDPAKAAAEINQAISAATDGHISQLVDASMLDDIGWVLTSALYLDAKWAVPFDASKTQLGTFTPAGAKPVTVKFMNGDDFRYAAGGGWQAVSLPYQGGKLAMTALLPPAGSAPCALPSQGSLTSITRSLDGPGAVADVSLPKVRLDTAGGAGDMKPALEQLGMGAAFSSKDADFSGLSPQACCIGFVQQAATLQVGEKGTVGAAAASVGMVASAAMVPQQTVTVTFDRPYALLITAQATGEPLFLATVDDPTAS